MAITGTKAFTSGEILTANDVNQYLMRGVKVFSSTAVRDAAYGGAGEPVLEEGETCFLADSNTLQVYDGSGWQNYPTTAQSGKLLQVVSTIKTDTFSASVTQGTNVDITGMSVSITPSSASSKILVVSNVTGSSNTGGTNRGVFAVTLFRGATAIGIGDTAGSRMRVSSSGGGDPAQQGSETLTTLILDSPATTSATTYKVAFAGAGIVTANLTMYLNRSQNDTDNSAHPRTASSITVMEISA